MGIIRQKIRLSNVHQPELDEIDALALVDSGALELCIPEHIALQLKLKHAGQRIIQLADGRSERVDVVTTVSVNVFGLEWNGQALVTGNEVLLGAIPMESMNLMIDPAGRRVFPNPESPNTPIAIAKGFRT